MLVLVLILIRQRRKARESLIYSNVEQNARYQDDYFDQEQLESWTDEQGFDSDMEAGMPDDPMAQADIFIAFGNVQNAIYQTIGGRHQ